MWSRPTSTPTRSRATPSKWTGRHEAGKTARFPEIDRAAWFDPATAKLKINAAQAGLIDELLTRI